MPNAAEWLHMVGAAAIGIRTARDARARLPAQFPGNVWSPQPGIPFGVLAGTPGCLLPDLQLLKAAQGAWGWIPRWYWIPRVVLDTPGGTG